VAPVSLNEQNVTVIRVKDTPLLERHRCRMQCKFKMPKLSHTTFTMVSTEMKMDLTAVHFIPPTANKMALTGEFVLPKTSSSEEIE